MYFVIFIQIIKNVFKFWNIYFNFWKTKWAINFSSHNHGPIFVLYHILMLCLCFFFFFVQTSELGVTEHIEGDECKFAVWTGRAPISDLRIILKVRILICSWIIIYYIHYTHVLNTFYEWGDIKMPKSKISKTKSPTFKTPNFETLNTQKMKTKMSRMSNTKTLHLKARKNISLLKNWENWIAITAKNEKIFKKLLKKFIASKNVRKFSIL